MCAAEVAETSKATLASSRCAGWRKEGRHSRYNQRNFFGATAGGWAIAKIAVEVAKFTIASPLACDGISDHSGRVGLLVSQAHLRAGTGAKRTIVVFAGELAKTSEVVCASTVLATLIGQF